MQYQSNYKAIVQAFNDKNKTSIGLEGGSRSGKTFDACIFIAKYCISFKNKKITIFRDYKSTLNKTTYVTFKEVFTELGFRIKWTKYADKFNINSNTITFIGINDSPDIAQGLESDLIYGNETDLCNENTYNQMFQRLKNGGFAILDYNPRYKHNWVYNLEKLSTHFIHKSTFLDNKFASKIAVVKIKSYEPTPENIANGTADNYLWKVYGLGERASGDASVFRPENLLRCETMPNDNECEWVILGGDFGWSYDPTTCCMIKKKDNNLYIKVLFYETGLLNKDIKDKLGSLSTKYVSVWDTQTSGKLDKNLTDLTMLNVACEGATKGSGSIAHGLAYLQQFRLHFLKDDLTELAFQEFLNASWLKNKQGDFNYNNLNQRILHCKEIKTLYCGQEVVIKDHALDAVRYGANYFNSPYKQDNEDY